MVQEGLSQSGHVSEARFPLELLENLNLWFEGTTIKGITFKSYFAKLSRNFCTIKFFISSFFAENKVNFGQFGKAV